MNVTTVAAVRRETIVRRPLRPRRPPKASRGFPWALTGAWLLASHVFLTFDEHPAAGPIAVAVGPLAFAGYLAWRKHAPVAARRTALAVWAASCFFGTVALLVARQRVSFLEMSAVLGFGGALFTTGFVLERGATAPVTTFQSMRVLFFVVLSYGLHAVLSTLLTGADRMT